MTLRPANTTSVSLSLNLYDTPSSLSKNLSEIRWTYPPEALAFRRNLYPCSQHSKQFRASSAYLHVYAECPRRRLQEIAFPRCDGRASLHVPTHTQRAAVSEWQAVDWYRERDVARARAVWPLGLDLPPSSGFVLALIVHFFCIAFSALMLLCASLFSSEILFFAMW